MGQESEQLTRSQLATRMAPSVPGWANTDDVISGILLSLMPPEQRTRGVEKSLNEPGVHYAWREEDASATKLALEVLSNLGEAFFTGPHGIAKLGFSLKELVSFLIDLKRNRARVSDPLEVSVLMLLRESHGGMTSRALRERLLESLGDKGVPTLNDVEGALTRLSSADTAGGPKELVKVYGQIWKCMV